MAPGHGRAAVRFALLGLLATLPVAVAVTLHWHYGPAPGAPVPAVPGSGAWGAHPFSDAAPQARPSTTLPSGSSAQPKEVHGAEPAALQPTPHAVPTAVHIGAPGLLTLEKADGGWTIDAQGASRLAMAARLAQLSGSTVSGALTPLATGGPQTLRWQGRDLAQAWKVVLGHEISYALQCSQDHCTVWLAEFSAPATTGVIAPPRE